jgi:hypothetical protein
MLPAVQVQGHDVCGLRLPKRAQLRAHRGAFGNEHWDHLVWRPAERPGDTRDRRLDFGPALQERSRTGCEMSRVGTFRAGLRRAVRRTDLGGTGFCVPFRHFCERVRVPSTPLKRACFQPDRRSMFCHWQNLGKTPEGVQKGRREGREDLAEPLPDGVGFADVDLGRREGPVPEDALDGEGPGAIALDGQYVYLAVDGRYVYFVTAGVHGKVGRIAKESAATVILADEQPFARSIAVDEQFVYWVNGGTRGTVKLTRYRSRCGRRVARVEPTRHRLYGVHRSRPARARTASTSRMESFVVPKLRVSTTGRLIRERNQLEYRARVAIPNPKVVAVRPPHVDEHRYAASVIWVE